MTWKVFNGCFENIDGKNFYNDIVFEWCDWCRLMQLEITSESDVKENNENENSVINEFIVWSETCHAQKPVSNK